MSSRCDSANFKITEERFEKPDEIPDIDAAMGAWKDRDGREHVQSADVK